MVTAAIVVVAFTAAEVSLLVVGLAAPEVMGPFGVALDVVVVVPIELLLVFTEVGIIRYIVTAWQNNSKDGLSVNIMPPWDPEQE